MLFLSLLGPPGTNIFFPSQSSNEKNLLEAVSMPSAWDIPEPAFTALFAQLLPLPHPLAPFFL